MSINFISENEYRSGPTFVFKLNNLGLSLAPTFMPTQRGQLNRKGNSFTLGDPFKIVYLPFLDLYTNIHNYWIFFPLLISSHSLLIKHKINEHVYITIDNKLTTS